MINNSVLKKTISAVLIFFILFLPTAVISQEADPSPTPTPVQTEITPTPTDSQQFESNHENSLDQLDTYVYGYPTPATLSGTLNSTDDVNVISSDSALIDLRIENTNDATVNRDTQVNNTTGGNSVSDNITLGGPVTLTTGDALSQATISTILNTNVVGLSVQPIVHNLFTSLNTDLDLSDIAACQLFNQSQVGDIQFNENTGNNVQLLTTEQLNENVGIYNTNTATVVNNVDLSSNTGDNSAVDNIGLGVKVTTGDASSTADIANIVNTNLVGNCGLFAVINVFSGGTGSIILPYERGYITPYSSNDSSSQIINSGDNLNGYQTVTRNTLLDITASNEASLSTIINANAITGDNTIDNAISFGSPISVTTGDNSSLLNTIDMTNINLFDNNFLFMKVNHNGHFKGNVVGWDGVFYATDDYFVLYTKIPTSSQLGLVADSDSQLINSGDDVTATDSAAFSSIMDIENNNKATITNNINLDANTGGNTAGRFMAQIDTGDAKNRANIFNMANTNIVGNNWYIAIINIFDDFFGNIIFPRPDLALVKSVSSQTAKRGNQLTYQLHYANLGQVTASHVTISDMLPVDVDIVSSSEEYVKNGNALLFNVDDVVPNQTGDIVLIVSINNTAKDSVTNHASITTVMDEPNKSNNTTEASTAITEQQSITQTQQTVPVTTQADITAAYTNPFRWIFNLKRPKLYHRNVSLVLKKKNVLGVNKPAVSNTRRIKTPGSILNGISSRSWALLLTAVIFYILGFASGVSFYRRRMGASRRVS